MVEGTEEQKELTREEKLKKKYDTLFEQLSITPKSRVILVRLADVCIELGRKDEALIFYKRAINFGLPSEEIEQKLKGYFSEKELEGIEFPKEVVPFWREPGKLLSYPFTLHGLVVIFAGGTGLTIFSLILFFLGGAVSLLADAPRFRIFSQRIMPLILVFVSVYIYAYVVKIIQKVSKGDDGFPEWLDFSELWNSILRPGFLVLTAGAISFFPAVVVIIFLSPSTVWGTLLLLACFLVGSPYFSMALLAAVKQDVFTTCFNFPLVIQSIQKVKSDYVKSLIAIWILGSVGTVLYFLFVRSAFPFIGLSVFWTVAVYFSFLVGYILGNLFGINRRVLSDIEHG
jgi:hypothetical protein